MLVVMIDPGSSSGTWSRNSTGELRDDDAFNSMEHRTLSLGILGPQRSVWAIARISLSGRAARHRACKCPRGVRRESAAPAAAAGQPGAAARTRRGLGRQDAVCPLRSEQLFGAARARSPRADGARRPARGTRRCRRRGARLPSAQLRPRCADRALSRRWSNRSAPRVSTAPPIAWSTRFRPARPS